MSQPPLGEIGTTRFLEEFWQRKPCLIRQAIPGFDPLLDGDDLAGLACEPMAESRIISGSYPTGNWALQQGPFEADVFGSLGETDWTLLVQDVEKHYPPLQSLMSRFDFLPSWRLDDLMVSFAAPGGSVGPHVDQYDVFLLQAQGRRRWQIAETFDATLVADAPVNVLETFTAEHDWTLDPGDMLYLPPNVAHHGVALDACMTYSIGLRAPSGADLHLALGEWLGNFDDQGGRYTDPNGAPTGRAGEIDSNAMAGMSRLLKDSGGDNPQLHRFLATFLSRYRMAHEPAPPPEPMTEADVVSRLDQGQALLRNPWTRLCWVSEGNQALLYAAGQEWVCHPELAESLCTPGSIDLPTGLVGATEIALLTALINQGHLYLSTH